MNAIRIVLGVALLAFVAPVCAGGVSGQYIEARTADVWVGACFANAEMNLTGKHAVLAWKVDRGEDQGVKLDGLHVVAVVEATDTLGLKQTGASKAVLVVDQKADAAQREALIRFAKKMGGDLVKNVVAVENKPIAMKVNCCEDKGCASLDAGVAKVQTRCIHTEEDKVCGHEDNFYPPLTEGLKVQSAMVLEHQFTGTGFNKTWNDATRRGAYVGSFSSK